jgi:hypothetical protein
MCTCKDFETTGKPCKHVFAVQFVIERESHPDGSETVTESVTVTRKTTAKRKTYRQVWPAYNAAQTMEKARFQVLLHDLCQGVPDLPRKPGPGRKPVPLADAIFAAAFKVYSTYGKPMQEYDWVKVSIITGVKTNVVTAVVVDEKKGGDCPQFAPLVDATAERFTINEVSADKAFASYANAELVAQHGGTPFIALPCNTTAARGGEFAKMFHFYQFNRDEFLTHYHKRSNVESTFSMIKAKFGDALRSKTDAAMVNEALAKILCHNLCCLIQSHYELGIEAKFWTDEPEPVSADPVDDMIEALAWV